MAIIDSVKLPDNSTYDLTDNYSGYAKKVASATTDDLASLTATGDLADSGKKLSDLVLKSDVKDVLNSTSTTDPLSANMGRVLNENIEAIVDVYGAKQMLPFPYEGGMSNTFRGITYNVSDKGVISTANTATNDGWFVLATNIALESGMYKIEGCPSGGSISTYRLTARVARSGGAVDNYYDVGEGQTFSFNEGDSLNVTINVGNGTDMDGLTFYPMLYDARITDPTYEPYAKTNKQLTADKAERADLATLNLTGSTNSTGSTINAGTFFYLNGSYCKAKTNIANGATFTLNTNFEVVTVGGVLSALNDKLANTFGSVVNIISYNSISNMFTCPNDGYIVLIADGAANSYTQAKNSNNDIIATAKTPTANQSFWVTISVRKGMQFYIVNTDATCAARYYPLT